MGPVKMVATKGRAATPSTNFDNFCFLFEDNVLLFEENKKNGFMVEGEFSLDVDNDFELTLLFAMLGWAYML